jgi:hypothetical protein
MKPTPFVRKPYVIPTAIRVRRAVAAAIVWLGCAVFVAAVTVPLWYWLLP